MKNCPRCLHDKVVKNGLAKGIQRYNCKSCKYSFTKPSADKKSPAAKAMAHLLYVTGLSFRATAKIVGASHVSVMNWIKAFARKNYEKPASTGAVFVELDEIWHFVGSKQNKLWIWKAFDSANGKLIDRECGDRDAATFQRMYKRLEERGIKLYCSDDYSVYNQVIPEDKRITGKNFTYRIEGNNSDTRHWHARFRRKSKTVSKSAELADLTMGLFAKHHVNEGLDSLLLPVSSLFS